MDMNETTLDEKLLDLLVDCLKENTNLPSEKVMIERFHTSRAQLRQALSVYEAYGVISARQGSGRTICTPDVSAPVINIWLLYIRANPMRLLDLLELRNMLELSSVDKVIAEATVEQIRAMLIQVLKMKEKVQQKRSFGKHDREFHRLMTSTVKNVFLSQLMDAFWVIYDEAHIETYHAGLEIVVERHEGMVNAIIRKDNATLSRLLTEELIDARNQIVMSLLDDTTLDLKIRKA